MEIIETIAHCDGPRGEVVLRRRVTDGRSIEELIINGTFAMDSSETSTERLLAELAVPHGNAERVLIGGLGLGYTLTAVAAKAVEVIDVVEIEQCLIDWAFQGTTSTLAAAAGDPRVRMHAGDVRLVLEGTPEAPVGPWDAIVIDVDNGPDFLIHGGNHTLYTATCLRAAYGQLTAGGTLAIWCQHPAPALLAVLQGITPSVHEHVIETPRGERTFPYTIYTISRANHSLTKAR
jgi:spermidine synthase